MAGRRQLCGCSAHLPPPESRALKLPGCGQPCCHGNCILHPCRRLHLKAIGENRGTRQTEEGEKTVAWPHSPSFPAQASLLTASHTGRTNCPSLPQASGRTASYPSPATTWRPWHSLLAGGAELTETPENSAPSHFNTCWALSTLRRRGLKKTKAQTSNPGPQASVGLRNVPASVSTEQQ